MSTRIALSRHFALPCFSRRGPSSRSLLHKCLILSHLCLSGPLGPQWDCLSLLSSCEVVIFIEKEKGLSPHCTALCKMGPGVASAELSLNLSLSNTHTHTHTHTHTQTHTYTHADTHTDTHRHTNTHTQTHTDTDTHTQTHRHTDTIFLSL